MPAVFPDYTAPIVRNGPDGLRELAKARWGMPSSQFALMQSAKKRAEKLEAKGTRVDFKQLLRAERDSGTTNIRNVRSKHWARWVGVANRCLVPFTSFSEFNKERGGDIWFALNDERPIAFFVGIWCRNGLRFGRSKRARRPPTVMAFLRLSRTARWAPSIPKRCRLSFVLLTNSSAGGPPPPTMHSSPNGRCRMARSNGLPVVSAEPSRPGLFYRAGG